MKDNGILKQFTKIDLVIISSAIIFLFLLPLIFTAESFWRRFDFSNTGQIGDTIGGITAPFIGLLAAYLVYKSFLVQYKANIDQANRFESSRSFDTFMRLYEFTNNKLNTFIYYSEDKNKYINQGESSFAQMRKEFRKLLRHDPGALHRLLLINSGVLKFNSILSHYVLLGKIIAQTKQDNSYLKPQIAMSLDLYHAHLNKTFILFRSIYYAQGPDFEEQKDLYQEIDMIIAVIEKMKENQ